MRGEYLGLFANMGIKGELPPRARRIPGLTVLPDAVAGTTSACAENTCGGTSDRGLCRNYLRVRGEYFRSINRSLRGMELPPRARRILPHPSTHATAHGTTSACAENTNDGHTVGLANGNYLRVRGEYHNFMKRGEKARGTTSACAENTLNELGLL